MASDDHLAHRRNQSANSAIPLQDLSEDGGLSPSQELGGGLNRGDSHRRTISERIAGFRSSRRGDGRYAPIATSEAATAGRSNARHRASPLSPVAIVTSPSGEHQRLPDEDDEVASPMVDPGAYQAAIGFMGLHEPEERHDTDPDNDSAEETPPRPQRASRTSLPSLRTNRDSLDDMVSVQLDDGPAFFSPAVQDEEDTEPLTDSSRARMVPKSSSGLLKTPEGQRHDRRRSSSGRLSGLSVRFKQAARLGDELHNMDGNASSESGLTPSPTSRKRSLSPASAESPLARSATMLRKMSQRVVNVSNEQVDSIVERNMKRRSSMRRPSAQGIPAVPTISETQVTDFAAVDGGSSLHHSQNASELPSFMHSLQQIPTNLPKIDRNPLRGRSLGIFPPNSPLRRRLLNFLVHPFWEPFILLLIICQTVILAINSAFDVATYPRPEQWGSAWEDYALFVIFVIYTIEIILKLIVSGFMFNPREYSTIDRSVSVRRAMWRKANDLFALHRNPSTRRMPGDKEDAPVSLLRSFTAQTFEETPGGSRQAQKKRLAHRAFLRHSFNRLDFVAVVSFWISFILAAFGVESKWHLYVFKMMSCLRIVRLLGITSGTSVILRSLKRAAPTLLNVSFLIGFFWLLFAIVGVQSFKSSLRRTCTWRGDLMSDTSITDPQENYTQNYVDGNGALQFCGGYLNLEGVPQPWIHANGNAGAETHKGYLCPRGSICIEGENPYNNTVSYDNILQSLEMVFVVMSTNTFSDIMYYLADTDYLIAAMYFAVAIVLLTFWLMNLLIAVITSSFQVIREESRSSAFMAAETDDDKALNEKDEGDSSDSEDADTEPRRRVPFLKRVYRRTKWVWIAIITFGLLVNCWRHANMGPFLTGFISAVQVIVSATLLGEIIFRFIADWRSFIHRGQDWFDLFLALITCAIEIPAIKNSHEGQAYAWLSVFQIIRVYRVVLAISITRELILLVLKHVSGVLNLILFVFLLTFLAAIFAVQLFRGEIPPENPAGASLQVTFNTIYNAYLGMYQILSSENWTEILYNATASQYESGMSWIGAAFIVLWFIVAFFITLNMFIAVIQENFDVSEDQKRLQQVRMFLQQKELGHSSQGSLSLSTIFKFGHVRRQDPLDFGNAATDMLLKDGIVKDFLDEQIEEMNAKGIGTNGHVKTGLTKQGTFDLLQGKQNIAIHWWQRLTKLFFDAEPNPFYTKLQLTKFYEEVNPATLAKEVVSAAELRKITQREYLRKHPTYNNTLYLFTPTNPLRRICQRIVGPGRGSERPQGVQPNITVWYSFSAFIYVAIVAMVLLACITTPLYQQEYFRNNKYSRTNWFILTDIGFAGLFSVEALIKVIADGFWFTPNAYFRSSWGLIDGIVLLTLWINVITALYDPGGGSRAVGAFKALRALRLLNVSDSARDTFHAVIVLGGWKVVSAALVSLSLLIPFAIYGLNLFAGRMMFCNEQNGSGNPIDVPIQIYNLTDCVGEFMYTSFDWEYPVPRRPMNTWYNFDSFGDALFVLFQIVSQEGWAQAMWSAQSITGIFTQPANFATQGNAVFFVVFNLLGAVFVLTLFVSVFMRNYTEQTGVAFLTTDQRSWLELRKLLRQVAPSKRPNANVKRVSWREWCYRRAVTKTGWWQRTVTGVLVAHLLILCVEFYPEPLAWGRARDYVFLFFTFVYYANIAVRILGLSWTRFRKSAWDVYSAISVTGTFATTVLLLSNFSNRNYVQLHKLFLVSVALLLIPRNNQLDQLFKTAAASLTSIANLLATWFVLFLVYAIAMNQAFGLTRFSWNETGNINVRTVPKALILLFRTSVGEGWNQLMEDFARVEPPFCTIGETYFEGDCGSEDWAYALFISWNILSMYIFVNLFISLIYESFSYVYQRTSGLSVISREEIRRFKQAWAEFDPNGTGYITKEQFPRFLRELTGVFEMRIYDLDFSVKTLIEDCKYASNRASALPLDGAPERGTEIDLVKLNRRLAELPVDQVRNRRARMNTFYEEVLVSADPDKGIPFNTLLMILAHYKVINENRSLKLEEFLRRKARLQRVQEAVNRNIVMGFFDTLYWRRNFRRIIERRKDARITAIPNYGVPEIFVHDEGEGEGDDLSQAKKFDIPSVAVTPVDYEPPDNEEGLGVGRAPASGSDAGYSSPGSQMRNRSGSIQSSAPSSPIAGRDSPYLSARHRPSPSSGSIQPDWHFAAAIENAQSPSGLSPPGSPRFMPQSDGAAAAGGATMSPTVEPRNRASSAVSQNEMMGMFQDSTWGDAMRRSRTHRGTTHRRRSERGPSPG